jgi:ketosteroid isomerase-like protein
MRAIKMLGLVLLLGACASTPPAPADNAELKRQVIATERAFAKTMADRDLAAFGTFISEEAVFFSDSGVLRGRLHVIDGWKPLYAKPAAPFSWEPEKVEVLDSGSLALSSGPVRDSKGRVFAIYSSIWRQESPGVWKIVFDKGSEVCDYEKK